MDGKTYYIDKTSDTSADTLLAVGFASLLREALRQRHKLGRILLEDRGTHYTIQLPAPITDNDLQGLKPFSLIQPLVTDKQEKKQSEKGQALDGFDYQGQQEISKTYYEKLKKLPPECRTPLARLNKSKYPLLAELEEPHWQLGHYRTISQMKIASSFNELAQRWLLLEELQRDHIHLLLTLFSNPRNDLEAAIITCQKIANEHELVGKTQVTAF